jgi:hypothetical protein
MTYAPGQKVRRTEEDERWSHRKGLIAELVEQVSDVNWVVRLEDGTKTKWAATFFEPVDSPMELEEGDRVTLSSRGDGVVRTIHDDVGVVRVLFDGYEAPIPVALGLLTKVENPKPACGLCFEYKDETLICDRTDEHDMHGQRHPQGWTTEHEAALRLRAIDRIVGNEDHLGPEQCAAIRAEIFGVAKPAEPADGLTSDDAPIEWHREHDGSLSLESVVFQALGAASMCWSETPTGVFDSRRAEKVGKALLAEIDLQRKAYPFNEGDVTVLGPGCFIAHDHSVLNLNGVNFVPQWDPDQQFEQVPKYGIPSWMKHVRAFDKGDIKCYVFKDNAEYEYDDVSAVETEEEPKPEVFNLGKPLGNAIDQVLAFDTANCNKRDIILGLLDLGPAAPSRHRSVPAEEEFDDFDPVAAMSKLDEMEVGRVCTWQHCNVPWDQRNTTCQMSEDGIHDFPEEVVEEHEPDIMQLLTNLVVAVDRWIDRSPEADDGVKRDLRRAMVKASRAAEEVVYPLRSAEPTQEGILDGPLWDDGSRNVIDMVREAVVKEGYADPRPEKTLNDRLVNSARKDSSGAMLFIASALQDLSEHFDFIADDAVAKIADVLLQRAPWTPEQYENAAQWIYGYVQGRILRDDA